MKKKIFLTFRTLIFLSLSFIIFYNFFKYSNIINLSPSLIEDILSYTPPLLAYNPPPLFLNIIFFITSIFLIFQPFLRKYLKNIYFKSFLKTYLLITDFLLFYFLFINFQLLLNHKVILPSPSFFYYKFVYYLYVFYFIILIYNFYNTLKKDVVN